MKTKGEATTTLPWGMILTIIFVVLKLCRVIEWSWVWVLAPFWIPVAFIIVAIIIYKLL